MKKLVENIIELDYESIDSYSFPQNELFGLKVKYKDILYCFIIKFHSKSENLICFGPGAHQRDKAKSYGESIQPPYFDRWSWHKYFHDSFIAYSDPMFLYDDEIVLGWFVGNKHQWYLEIVALIIKKLSINQRINNENILFFGSSGGGFASVCLGTLIKGSKVMVNNAQFFILNFNLNHVLNTLFRILENDFQLSRDEIIKLVPYRFDVVELFKKERYVPEIIYYVNVESKNDINSQGLPLINKILKMDYGKNKLTVHFYHEIKEKVHNPLPNNLTIKYIQNYLNSINKIQINKIYFKIPSGFQEIISNIDIEISNGELSIYFKVYENSELKECIENYKFNKEKNKFSVMLSKFDINDLQIYKSTIVGNDKLVHYWFKYQQDIYEIYTWNAGKTIDSIIFNLVETAQFINLT